MNSNAIILWLSICVQTSYTEGEFSYKNTKKWGKIAPICNQGKRQSPIALYDKNSKFLVADKSLINFINYPAEIALISGEESDWSEGNAPHLTGHLFNHDQYNFNRLHAHSKFENDDGTEHSINGQKYTVEVHFLHINDKYASVREAAQHPDGIAVVGVLFDTDDDRRRTSEAGCTFDVNAVKSFYTYRGSLTTPPCTENVRWIVADEVFGIHERCVEEIRETLPDGELSNARPLQPLHNRTVTRYKLKCKCDN